MTDAAVSSDLFDRLNVVPLWLQPLRARRSISISSRATSARALRSQLQARHPLIRARSHCSASSAGRHRATAQNSWSGGGAERWTGLSANHVREELSRHVRFTTQANTKTTAASLPAPTPMTVESGSISEVAPLENALHVAERRALVRALKHAGGNRSRAARMLGVSRSTLYVKLQEHDLL